MANAVIGALRVNLGIDSAQFKTGLKDSRTRLDKFARTATKAFAATAAAATAVGGAIAVGLKRTIDEADKMTKLAQSIGIPVDELSRLKHAADLSGVGIEGLSTAIRRLSKNMFDIAAGAGQEAKRAFDALGVSTMNADGSLKTSSQIMTEVAGKFSVMEDGAEKTALAVALFGRAGASLIPMLNQGADGIRQMMEEADQLGIVLSGRTGKAAEAFNDNLNRLSKVKDGLYLVLAEKLLPALETLTTRMVEFMREEGNIKGMVENVGGIFEWLSQEIASVAIVAARLRVELAAIMETFNRLKSGDFSGAWAAFKEGQDASAEMAANIRKDIEGIFSEEAGLLRGDQTSFDQAFGRSGRKAGESFVVNFNDALTGGGGGSKGMSAMAREAASIFEQTRTPLEQYQAQIARLNELLAASAINQDTYNRAVIQAQDTFDKASKGAEKNLSSLEKVGESIGQTVASSFQGLIDGSKKLKDVLKDLLSQLSSMVLNSAFQAIIGSAFGGGGGGIFAGIGKLLGFANGGSFQVGGAGGIDSQLVAFRASPNETVSVTKPGQRMGGGETYAPVYNIDARGADQAAITRLERALAERDRNFGKMVDQRNDTRQTRRTRG